jgi:hypothetical protein
MKARLRHIEAAGMSVRGTAETRGSARHIIMCTPAGSIQVVSLVLTLQKYQSLCSSLKCLLQGVGSPVSAPWGCCVNAGSAPAPEPEEEREEGKPYNSGALDLFLCLVVPMWLSVAYLLQSSQYNSPFFCLNHSKLNWAVWAKVARGPPFVRASVVEEDDAWPPTGPAPVKP